MQGASTDRRSIGHSIGREDIKEREVESLMTFVYICHQNGGAQVAWLNKLKFALSSLAQPGEKMIGIWKRFFIIIISQHKSCAKRFLEEIAEQRTAFARAENKMAALKASIYNSQNRL